VGVEDGGINDSDCVGLGQFVYLSLVFNQKFKKKKN
jgi:hypothetical protein